VREYTQGAIDTLVLVILSGKPGEAAMAANSLLDCGWGKAQVSAAVAVNTDDLKSFTPQQLLAELAAMGVVAGAGDGGDDHP
jgi:hypothetical protein